MSRKIQFNQEARESLLAGANKIANAVKATLGPLGKNAILGTDLGAPTSTKDGVSVAKYVELPNKLENQGARALREAAIKTVGQAGDGTTSTIVLAQSILNSGMDAIKEGYNAVDLKRGIDKAVEIVVGRLKEMSTPVNDSYEKILQVATISANNDAEIGKLVADAISKVGLDGVVHVVESNSTKSDLSFMDGMVLNSGYTNVGFVTDAEKMEAVLENPLVLMTSKSIEGPQQLIPFLDSIAKIVSASGQKMPPVLIISDGIDSTSMAVLATNFVKGTLKSCVVNVPHGHPEQRDEFMEDLAVMLDGKYVTDYKGDKIEDLTISELGSCSKVVIGKDSTTFIGAAGDESAIGNRIASIRLDVASAQADGNEPRVAFLKERIAKLSSGIAVIEVGAPTNFEMKERKDRFDDAVGATRAAMEEGIVPGGGTSYLRCNQIGLEVDASLSKSQLRGMIIVMDALLYPLLTICENGEIDASVVISEVKSGNGAYGYNAYTEKYGNMIEMGIIDPTKVARVALENAASIAGMLLTTEVLIVND